VATAEDFDPGLPDRVRARIRAALGPTWERIVAADLRGQQATPPNPHRHLLAVIHESVGLFNLEEVAARYPGRLPDLLALTAMANIIDRSRDFEALAELVPAMISPKGFRHHMLTLGLADHLRTYTPYTVRLPIRAPDGGPIVDLLLSHSGQTMEIETKTSDEFDGPRREVSPSNARGAISRAWGKAVSGPRAQLGRNGPGLLLLGGITLQVESLDVIRDAASDWLSAHGRSHPNVWGIAVLTYWTYTLGSPAQELPSVHGIEIHARGGVQLRAAENPFYRGPIRLVLAPYAPEDREDRRHADGNQAHRTPLEPGG
jgi:hypothetical protein